MAILTCPKCGYRQKLKIPDRICIPFYRCNGCSRIIRAEKSCCVFCDYGDERCSVGHKA